MEVLVATNHTFPVPGYKTEHGLSGMRLVFVPKPRRNVAKQCEKVEGCADHKAVSAPALSFEADESDIKSGETDEQQLDRAPRVDRHQEQREQDRDEEGAQEWQQRVARKR